MIPANSGFDFGLGISIVRPVRGSFRARDFFDAPVGRSKRIGLFPVGGVRISDLAEEGAFPTIDTRKQR
ncbi:MAG: hypothetical protein CMI60_18640 [Parvibaculum sp.]|nr:hypothetical protein [Parvibaculum sp.]